MANSASILIPWLLCGWLNSHSWPRMMSLRYAAQSLWWGENLNRLTQVKLPKRGFFLLLLLLLLLLFLLPFFFFFFFSKIPPYPLTFSFSFFFFFFWAGRCCTRGSIQIWIVILPSSTTSTWRAPLATLQWGGLYMSVMAQEMRHQKKLENVMLLSLIPGDVDFTHVWENFRLEIKELQVRKFCCLLNPFLFCSFFFLLLFLRQKVSRFDTQSAENNSLTESNWGCSRRTALKGRGIWTMSVLRPGSAVPDAMPPRFLLSSLSSRKQFLILSCLLLLSSFYFLLLLLPPPPPPLPSFLLLSAGWHLERTLRLLCKSSSKRNARGSGGAQEIPLGGRFWGCQEVTRVPWKLLSLQRAEFWSVSANSMRALPPSVPGNPALLFQVDLLAPLFFPTDILNSFLAFAVSWNRSILRKLRPDQRDMINLLIRSFPFPSGLPKIYFGTDDDQIFIPSPSAYRVIAPLPHCFLFLFFLPFFPLCC